MKNRRDQKSWKGRFSPSLSPVLLLTGGILPTLILGACGDSSTGPEDPFAAPPVIAALDRDLSPAIPSELNIYLSCWDGPDSPQPSISTDSCPVLQWGGMVYWIYTDGSNGSSMTLIAYDGEGERVGTWERTGARYLWQITIDETEEIVTLWGQASRTIEIPWADLRVE